MLESIIILLILFIVIISILFLSEMLGLITLKNITKEKTLLDLTNANQIILYTTWASISIIISISLATIISAFLSLFIPSLNYGYLLSPLIYILILIIGFICLNFVGLFKLIKDKKKSLYYSIYLSIFLITTIFILLILSSQLVTIGWITKMNFFMFGINMIIPGIITILLMFNLIPKEAQKLKNGKKLKKMSNILGSIILLSIIFVFLLGFTYEPPTLNWNNTNTQDAISNGLSSVANGGSTTTQSFTLQKGALMTSEEFSNDGFDSQSIIFAIDESVPESFSSVENNITEDIHYSRFMYNSETNFRANTRIICELTGTDLAQTLIDFDIENEVYDLIDPISYCGGPEDEFEYSPCCLVIIQRAK